MTPTQIVTAEVRARLNETPLTFAVQPSAPGEMVIVQDLVYPEVYGYGETVEDAVEMLREARLLHVVGRQVSSYSMTLPAEASKFTATPVRRGAWDTSQLQLS